MLLERIVRASEAAGATQARKRKVAALAECLAELAPEELEIATAWLAGELRQGRIGVGYAAVRRALECARDAQDAVPSEPPTLARVDAALDRIAQLSGKGAASERRRLLGALLAELSPAERNFLARLLLGELRQGALAGVLLEAVASAAGLAAAALRRAAMLGGSLRAVASAALREGEPGLARFRLELFRPVQPMLALTADDVGDALARLGRAAFEWKLDGARVQVHRGGDTVRVFTRRGNEVTPAVPEIVETVRALPLRSVVLDGEALALRADGRPLPFQVTMRRFGRRLDVAALRRELPLSLRCFDCLLLDGADLSGRPAHVRVAALESALPAELRVPRSITGDAGAAQAFLADALARGHEGVMAKSLDHLYEAGSRGAGWLKLKRAHSLDLVVLAAEWGSGRRRGWLSNLHLGARDPAGGFVMLGKTFKGLPDETLAWQTERLQRLATSSEGHVVHVRPELVVEIAFDGVQRSPRYPGGVALRFARVKGYRLDKRAEDADAIDAVRALLPDPPPTR
jgi:DNA ligase-1